MVVYAFDDWNRADGAPGNIAGGLFAGEPWTVLTGTAEIVANELVALSGTVAVVHVPDPGIDDLDVTVTPTALGDAPDPQAGDPQAGPIARLDGSSAYRAVAGPAGIVQLIVGTASPTVLAETPPGAWGPGDPITLRCVGSQISVLVAGAVRIAVEDDTVATGGFGVFGTENARFGPINAGEAVEPGWQVTIRGRTFGDGQHHTYLDRAATLFGGWAPRTPRSARSQADGSVAVQPDRHGSQRLLIPIEIMATSQPAALDTLEVLAAAFALAGPDEPDVRLDLITPQAHRWMRGRPVPPDEVSLDRVHGNTITAVCEFEATDPRRYAPNLTVVATPTGGVDGGLGFPHGFPHGFGEGRPGRVEVTSDGTAPTPPGMFIVAHTDLERPRLELLEPGLRLRFDGTLAAGRWLLIDFWAGRIVEQTSLTADFSINRRPMLDGQFSTWWRPDRRLVPPGTHTFSFTAASGQGTAALFFHDAWLT